MKNWVMVNEEDGIATYAMNLPNGVLVRCVASVGRGDAVGSLTFAQGLQVDKGGKLSPMWEISINPR